MSAWNANGIEESKQVPALLTAIGGQTYALLRNLLAPAKPNTKTFAQLKEALKQHYDPKPLVIAERFYFHRRCQQAGESIAEYIAELRRLATNCEFGENLEQALRDRLVCGLKHEPTQKRLLTEASLTLAKAIEIAQSTESAERNALQLKGGAAAEVMHMRKFVLETEILGSCKKQIRRFVLIKIKELMCHSISRETTRIINLAKPAD